MFIIYQSGNQKQKLEEAQTTQNGQKKDRQHKMAKRRTDNTKWPKEAQTTQNGQKKKDKNTNNDPQKDIQKTTH